MNILKIKIIILSIFTAGSTLSLTAQNLKTNDTYGASLKSLKANIAQLNFRGGGPSTFSNNLGSVMGHVASDGSKTLNLRNDAYKNVLTVRGLQVGIGNDAEILNLFNDDNGQAIPDTKYKLFVQTGILTEKVKVAVAGLNDWADYVFEEDYEMMEINELEDYVSENKHLPNVPSAEEMVENGLDVAKMDAKLLEKIEEAYLYIIDINKAMEAMNEKVDVLSAENEVLKTSLQSLNTLGK